MIIEPVGLPPQRSHDHRIPLLSDHKLTALPPYHYPHFQKNEIERMVKEMLTAGIIRPNTSPYFSPILIAKKHDESCSMCVDY